MAAPVQRAPPNTADCAFSDLCPNTAVKSSKKAERGRWPPGPGRKGRGPLGAAHAVTGAVSGFGRGTPLLDTGLPELHTYVGTVHCL